MFGVGLSLTKNSWKPKIVEILISQLRLYIQITLKPTQIKVLKCIFW